MKVIFLDFDGVLNSRQHLNDICAYPRGSEVFPDDGAMIEGALVRRVQKICDATGAVVVLSTSWRLMDRFDTLVDWLREKGLRAEVVGQTPRSGRERGWDIDEWLDLNGRNTTFIILDDSDEMVHHCDRLIRTNTEIGIEDHHVERAITMLGE